LVIILLAWATRAVKLENTGGSDLITIAQEVAGLIARMDGLKAELPGPSWLENPFSHFKVNLNQAAEASGTGACLLLEVINAQR